MSQSLTLQALPRSPRGPSGRRTCSAKGVEILETRHRHTGGRRTRPAANRRLMYYAAGDSQPRGVRVETGQHLVRDVADQYVTSSQSLLLGISHDIRLR